MQSAIERLNAAERIAISAHERPDGDAIGAALGLCRILRGAGKEAMVLGLTPLPDRYQWMPQSNELAVPEADWTKNYDVFVALDCGAFDRLGGHADEARAAAIPVVNIDHHDSNSRFGDTNWVEADASSTGEMVFQMAKEAGWLVCQAAAEALWVAIVTDTGRFAYENTGARTLRIGAELVELGVKPAAMDQVVYQSVSLKELEVTRRALATLTLSEEGQVATVILTEKDFTELDALPTHAQDVINLPRCLFGVKAAFFFYELTGEGQTKVSVRSAAPLDASALCQRFGGGGHQRAAGCTLPGSAEAARTRILEVIHEEWFAG